MSTAISKAPKTKAKKPTNDAKYWLKFAPSEILEPGIGYQPAEIQHLLGIPLGVIEEAYEEGALPSAGEYEFSPQTPSATGHDIVQWIETRNIEFDIPEAIAKKRWWKIVNYTHVIKPENEYRPVDLERDLGISLHAITEAINTGVFPASPNARQYHSTLVTITGHEVLAWIKSANIQCTIPNRIAIHVGHKAGLEPAAEKPAKEASNLIEQLSFAVAEHEADEASREREYTASLWQRYASILQRCETPKGDDVEKLLHVMNGLGINQDQVTKDVVSVKFLQDLQGRPVSVSAKHRADQLVQQRPSLFTHGPDGLPKLVSEA